MKINSYLFGIIASIFIVGGFFVNVGPKVGTEPDTPRMTVKEANSRKTVCIDAGHQLHGNNEKEPDGPGATQMKAKVSSGTSGKVSGLPEYRLNLSVSLKLKDILLERGYRVVMVRETNEVDISNSERAAIANNANADVFLRIHGDSSEDTSVNGAMTICQTKKNKYNADLYPKSRLLSECVLDNLCEKTGAKKRRVWETDTMSGINWCRVPVTIVEMGCMSNKEEDLLLASDEYQSLLAEGIADGVDTYFGELKNE